MSPALTPSGNIITCDGCGAPVEQVHDDMKHPTPEGLYVGPDITYIVCAPLPDGTQPCLTLARLADELHLRTCATCRRSLGTRLDAVIAELTQEPTP